VTFGAKTTAFSVAFGAIAEDASTLGCSILGAAVAGGVEGVSPPLCSYAIFFFKSAIFRSVSANFAFAASDFYFFSSIF